MRLACSMLAVFVVLSPFFCNETNRAKKHGRVGVSRPTTQRLRSPSASTAPKPVCHPYSQSLAHGARARKSSNASHVLRQQHPAPTIEAPSAYAQRRSAPVSPAGAGEPPSGKELDTEPDAFAQRLGRAGSGQSVRCWWRVGAALHGSGVFGARGCAGNGSSRT